MHPEIKDAARLLGFLLGVFGVMCLGAAGMSLVNAIAGYYDDSPANYLVIAAVSLILAVIAGFLSLALMSWSSEEPAGRGPQA